MGKDEAAILLTEKGRSIRRLGLVTCVPYVVDQMIHYLFGTVQTGIVPKRTAQKGWKLIRSGSTTNLHCT